MNDKFTATWISHTSTGDYLRCPRSYYLKNVYKDRATGHKIQIVSPALSLGSAVHEIIEGLSQIPTQKRFSESLVLKFDRAWEKYTGKKGGFTASDEEFKVKERGKAMLRRIMDNPGPLAKLAIKLKQDFLYYWLSEKENIILCGKIDWLEYLQETDSVHIIDFKTSKKEEQADSLQLPIYLLLSENCQSRKVDKLSYWYLEYDDLPTRIEPVDLKMPQAKLLEIGRKIKLAKKLNNFSCPSGKDGCFACRSLEAIIRGEGEKVRETERHDLYFLKKLSEPVDEEVDEEIIH